MNTYEFSIVATGLSLDNEDWQDRFIDAGIDDALASIQRGNFVLRFDREATDFEAAIRSAFVDIECAGASVCRVEPDPLVSASDIAERSGISRQLVSLYANGSRGHAFPAPSACVTTAKPLWKWSEVAKWLVEHGKLDPEAEAQALIIEAINAKIEEDRQLHLQVSTASNLLGKDGSGDPATAGFYVGPADQTEAVSNPPQLRIISSERSSPGADFLRPQAGRKAVN